MFGVRGRPLVDVVIMTGAKEEVESADGGVQGGWLSQTRQDFHSGGRCLCPLSTKSQQ